MIQARRPPSLTYLSREMVSLAGNSFLPAAGLFSSFDMTSSQPDAFSGFQTSGVNLPASAKSASSPSACIGSARTVHILGSLYFYECPTSNPPADL